MSTISDLLTFPFLLSKATRALQQKLAAAIARYNGDHVDLCKQAEALRDVSDAEWSPEHDATATRLRTSQIKSLQTEIALRSEVDAFYGTIDSQDRPTAVDAALATHEKTAADVRQKLVDIGFVLGK